MDLRVNSVTREESVDKICEVEKPNIEMAEDCNKVTTENKVPNSEDEVYISPNTAQTRIDVSPIGLNKQKDEDALVTLSDGLSPLTVHNIDNDAWMDFVTLCAKRKFRDEVNHSLLDVAVLFGSPDIVLFILEKGGDKESRNRKGQTALHLACQLGHFDVVRILLEGRFDVGAKDKDQKTALHMAAEVGRKDIVEVLCKFKADVNVLDREGRSPLSLAVEFGHSPVVKYLLSCGCSYDTRLIGGSTLLEYATKMGYVEIFDVLVENGALPKTDKSTADICQLAVRYNYLDVLRKVLFSDSVQDIEGDCWSNVLMVAYAERRLDAALILLERGCRVVPAQWTTYSELAAGSGSDLQNALSNEGQVLGFSAFSLDNSEAPTQTSCNPAPFSSSHVTAPAQQVALPSQSQNVSDDLPVTKSSKKPGSVWKCLGCGKILSSWSGWTHHRRGCKQNAVQCKECGIQLSSANSLRKHRRIHSEEKPFQCVICGIMYKLEKSLREHLGNHLMENQTVSKFQNPTPQIDRVPEEPLIPVHKGDTRERVANSQEDISTDVHQVESDVPDVLSLRNESSGKGCGAIVQNEKVKFECSECVKKFANRRKLKSHLLIHMGKQFECTECHKKFFTKHQLQVHHRIHTGERPHKCKECGNCFKDLSSLRKHGLLHVHESPYQCNLCGNEFATKGNLETHKRSHKEETQFHCEECGKSFAYLKSLNSHKMSHIGKRLFKCKDCGEGFRTAHLLEVHRKTHAWVKLYPCGICDDRFVTKRSLKAHRKRHYGEKLYWNEFCEEGSLGVENHMHEGEHQHSLVQPGDKPHGSEVCGEKNGGKRSRVVRKKVWTCIVCGKQFPFARDLNKHRKTHGGKSVSLEASKVGESVGDNTPEVGNVVGGDGGAVDLSRDELPQGNSVSG